MEFMIYFEMGRIWKWVDTAMPFKNKRTFTKIKEEKKVINTHHERTNKQSEAIKVDIILAQAKRYQGGWVFLF